MGLNLARKILQAHLLSGVMEVGEEIAIRVDQTLTHDVTGTQAYLAFETMNVPKVKTDLSVSYIDHNLLYADNKNPDDHAYLQSIAQKYGLYLSRAGNGICHTVHFERFGKPGAVLLGSDSHTPTGSAIGALAIGAGGLDVALAMAGKPLYLKMPRIVNVVISGRLRPGVAAKDIILELLRRETVKGGVGTIYEYSGEGVATLSIYDRSTITNMGAELGATTSVFPSDETVRDFFRRQQREQDWQPLFADDDADYDGRIDIDLSSLEPLVAQPDMPDNVCPAADLSHVKLDQVFIGSCTNASYTDLAKAAAILKGHSVHPDVSLVIAPGSRQIFSMLLRDGVIADLIAAGARLLESGCGPCVGIGQAPRTDGVSLRTSNRNFKGRSGTLAASIYLSSPEVAAASAITGYITVPDDKALAAIASVKEPTDYIVNDNMILPPATGDTSRLPIVKGPNIKPMPVNEPLPATVEAAVSAYCPDNITTDDIIPANAQFSALRSNIPAISEITFSRIDLEFVTRAKHYGRSFIVGGENYGQGSSREHAAIAPMYLGVKGVIVKSLARIHKNNLINHGVVPMTFADPADYDGIDGGDILRIDDFPAQLRRRRIDIKNLTKGTRFTAVVDVTDREADILIAGGQLRRIQTENANPLDK